jgi:glycosyltransferase involved in cell wall biosynthesis
VKILVYDDNPDYGGHQVMACIGIEALVDDPALEVIFMCNPRNTRLIQRLAVVPNLQKIETPYSTHKFQGLINRVSQKKAHRLAQIFSRINPDRILCIQGEIEDSSHAILAARKEEIPCISYLAIPHRMADMGAKLGGLRDRFNQYLFNQPTRYIAISKHMADLLKERGVNKPIDIIPNGICTPSSTTPKTQTSTPVLGLLGRIEFNQKGQDFMVQTFSSFPQQFDGCRLLMVGDGPDTKKLKALVSGHDRITVEPWHDDIETFYNSIDYLMLPSRFEGVPLVMLEALARGIPVIGSNCDGMQDLLPESWTFESGSGEAFANTFANIRKNKPPEIDALQHQVSTENTRETFKAAFHQAVVKA